MKTEIRKFGNSKGIIIPSAIIKTLGLEEKDSLILKVEENKIIMKKTEKNKPKSLIDLFKGYKGDYDFEVVFDDVMGDEEW
ncbi:MAG: AbrB/MazE/SpoVT family DNA-binding domain-containing protein [Acholeplasmatales bacterium]